MLCYGRVVWVAGKQPNCVTLIIIAASAQTSVKANHNTMSSDISNVIVTNSDISG